MTNTIQIITQTILPTSAVTSLLSQAKMQSGAVNAPDANGDILVQGQASLTIPADKISSFVDAPTGYASVVFVGGHFNLDATGENAVLTANWNVSQ